MTKMGRKYIAIASNELIMGNEYRIFENYQFYIFYVHFAQLNVSLIEMKREYTFLISIIAQLISNFKHTKIKPFGKAPLYHTVLQLMTNIVR